LSCHRFWANQFQLLLHAAAFQPGTRASGWPIRRWLAQLRVPHLQLATLRLRLIKIGGWVRHHLDAVRLHLTSSHPGESLWHLLATRPGRS
jgi:Transposase DDE domain group 1